MNPRMAVIGVRISWLMLARNSLLAWLAHFGLYGHFVCPLDSRLKLLVALFQLFLSVIEDGDHRIERLAQVHHRVGPRRTVDFAHATVAKLLLKSPLGFAPATGASDPPSTVDSDGSDRMGKRCFRTFSIPNRGIGWSSRIGW